MLRYRKVGNLPKVAMIVLVFAVLLSSSISLAPPAKAQGCHWASVYTDYFDGDPGIKIYTNDVQPLAHQLRIFYFSWGSWAEIPTPSDGTIRTDAPQTKEGGWVMYNLATRWYLRNSQWNDDVRWAVRYCPGA